MKRQKKKRIMTENSLMNTYKQRYLEEKVKILGEIYEEALKICSKKP